MSERKDFLLIFGFGLVICLMVVFGITSAQKSDKLAALTGKLYRHPLAVSNAVLEANADIIAMHRHMKDVVLAQNDDELEQAISKVDAAEKEVLKHFEVVINRFLGDKNQILDVYRAFAKALKPFEQADGTHSRRHEGTGLGLHLCVNFMKLFGGSLEIESEVDKGTTIALIFPPERTVIPD